ncbi:MAG: hypothetical protein HY268_28005 [Deltaproteobacteria bacterium]|nr:hypothetical protein [Deltaproteobacteria bacterium]
MSLCFYRAQLFAWSLVSFLLLATVACAAPDARPYAILTSALTCEQAQQLAARVTERLGYAITSSSPASGTSAGIIHGARQGVDGQETVSVKVSCGVEGVRVDAEADIPPCEQANRLAQRTVEHLGYTVTSFVPAITGEKVGIVKGKREGGQVQDSVALSITCTPEAVYVDTRSDSPLAASTDFTAAITDFRRGFFALFKPAVDAAQRQGQR